MNHVFIPFEYHGFIVTKRGRQAFQEDNNGNILPFFVDFTPSSYISDLEEEDREELFYRMLDSLKTDTTFKFRLFANEGFRITAVSIDPEVKYSDEEIKIGALVYPVYEDAMRRLLKFSYSYLNTVSRQDLVFVVYEPIDKNEKKRCCICPIDTLPKILDTFGTTIESSDGRLDIYTLDYSYEIYQANCSYREDDTNYGNIIKISCKCYNYYISTEWHSPDADEDAFDAFMQCRASNILHVMMANFFGLNYDSEDVPIQRDSIIIDFDWNDYELIAEGKYILSFEAVIITPRIGRSFFKFIPSEADISKDLYAYYPTKMSEEKVKYLDILGSLNYSQNGFRNAYYIPIGLSYRDDGYSSGGHNMYHFSIQEMRKFTILDKSDQSPSDVYRHHTLINAVFLSMVFDIPIFKESFLDSKKNKDRNSMKYFFDISGKENIDKAINTLTKINEYFNERGMKLFPLIDSIGYEFFEKKDYKKLIEVYKEVPFVVSDSHTVNQKHPSNSGLHSDMEELKCLWS